MKENQTSVRGSPRLLQSIGASEPGNISEGVASILVKNSPSGQKGATPKSMAMSQSSLEGACAKSEMENKNKNRVKVCFILKNELRKIL